MEKGKVEYSTKLRKEERHRLQLVQNSRIHQ